MKIIVTKIVQAVDPTKNKVDELYEIARKSADLRNDLWNQYGSVSGLSISRYPRAVRDAWVKNGQGLTTGLQARAWKGTMDEAFGTVKSLWSNAKTKVRSALYKLKRFTKEEKHYVFYLLKADELLHEVLTASPFDLPEIFKGKNIDREKVHKWLASRLRAYKGSKPKQKKATTFTLDSNMYDLKEDEKGRLWLGVMSLTPRKRIHLRLSSPRRFSGNIRVVLRGGQVEIHYTGEEDCPEPKEGQKVVGIDKGFKEVLTDSEGTIYGEGFGEQLRTESDRLSEKNKKRNNIRAVAEKSDLEKAERIKKNNLGRKKYNKHKWTARNKINTHIGTAVHEFFQQKQPDVVAGEALNFNYQGKKSLPKKVRRYFSSWLKGVLQVVIEMRCLRSGATYASVNAAYTSQVCSWCGWLGKRSGDTFHCLNVRCGRVVDADYNGARNVALRYEDRDISLFTPFMEVKRILEQRFRSGETVHPGPEILALV